MLFTHPAIPAIPQVSSFTFIVSRQLGVRPCHLQPWPKCPSYSGRYSAYPFGHTSVFIPRITEPRRLQARRSPEVGESTTQYSWHTVYWYALKKSVSSYWQSYSGL